MTAVLDTSAATPVPGRRGARVETAIARRSFRQLWVGATIWAVVFGVTVAASALTYVRSFPDQASRQALAATTSGDTGVAMLLGPVSAIDTVGGYTVYKTYVFLTTIGAIWGVLAATRLLRGEEDGHRWQLVLAGGTRASRATAATLAALGAAAAVIFAGTTLITLLAARNPDLGFGVGETVLFGLSIAIAPAVFVGVGALASQLGRSRRVATGVGLWVVGIAFVLRMIADSGTSTHWLLWLTPFGWIERIRPLSENDPWPLVPAAVTIAVLATASILLASRRDAGDGVLASNDVARPRAFGLGSTFGLAVRLELPVLVAWCAGALAAALAFGVVAKMATGAVPSSVSDLLDKFGVHGAFLRQYFGVVNLLIATIVALLPASQVGAMAEEEGSGRLVHLLAQPVRRRPLLGQRLLLAAAAVVAAAALAGLGMWLGAVTQGISIGFLTLLRAGLNVVPTALLVLGIGAVVLARWPRAAAPAVYAVVLWSLLIDLFGSMVTGLHSLEHLSLFHYLALAPAEAADPVTIVVTLVLAAALGIVATVLFERRDVGTG
jgi:ABC-2 type transport system permease protein